MTNVAVSTTVANADTIFAAAKRLKAIKNRYETKADAERRARDAITELQQEAHAATTAMVQGGDTDDHRDLAVIQKALLRAHNMLDKTIEKGHDDREDAAEAHQKLLDAINGELPETPSADTDDQQEAA